MKKLTKKTFVGLFALVLAVVALGTTTFAWFTIGNTVEVQDFELNVTGGEGLEVVYLDKENNVVGTWSTILATDVLLKNIAKEYDVVDVVNGSEGDPVEFKKQFKFDAVTSDDGLAFKKLELEPNVQLTPISDLRKLESGVLEFKLRFRTIAEPTGVDHVKLQWNGVTLKSNNPVNWTPDLPFTGVGGGTVSGAADYYASNGARISVNGNLSAPVVYESPSTATGNTVLSNNVPNWTQGAHDYFKVITGINLGDKFGGAQEAYKAAPTVQEIGSTSANIKHVANFGDDVDADGYRYADVTIRIYLEGFDADTFNAILTGSIQIALQFTFKE